MSSIGNPKYKCLQHHQMDIGTQSHHDILYGSLGHPGYLVQKWGEVSSVQMEDDVKTLFKKLKELKVDRKCDAYLGTQDHTTVSQESRHTVKYS
eukprot:785071-Amphidinium_carterae.1